jgi:ribose-phosphate pyrophosphokinase
MMVVLGPSSPSLGRGVAEMLGAKAVPVEYKNFPDGESYVRVAGGVKGEDVVLVQTTYPQPDKRLIELLLLIDALKDLEAARIAVVVPYMAYARQDTRFREGEAVSIKTLFRAIEGAGCDEFYTVDLHKEFSLEAFGVKAKNIYASEAIASHLRGMGLREPYILSPDKGAINIAKRVADMLGAEYGHFEKTRDRITGAISVKGERLEVRGRPVVITDDLISTGGTIANAAKLVKEAGGSRVVAVCTHPLLVAGAYDRMRASGVDEILGTDTIEGEISKISVAPLIARELR